MDTLLEWLPRVASVLMMGIGVIGFVKPGMILDPMGIKMETKVGTSEIRAVFGGLNLGAAACALYFNDSIVYTTLGVAWGGATAARFYSIAVDGSTIQESIPPIVFDGALMLLFLSATL